MSRYTGKLYVLAISEKMIIVIDAYNLLRALPPYGRKITDPERNKFLAEVGLYGRRKGHKMVVVFDGGPFEWPLKERVNGVQVVYSGAHESADDYIKEYLDSIRTQDVLLVSSDHELNVWAAQLDIPSIGSFTFYQLMQEALRAGELKKEIAEGKPVKITEREQEDVDKIMQEASKVVPIKSEDVVRDRKDLLKKGKPGKRERKLLKKLKKL